MQFSLAAVTAFAGIAFAGVIARDDTTGPVNVPASSPDNAGEGSLQAITHLYVCTDANFSGRCQNLQSNTGQCYNLFNGFSDSISSLGPDAGTSCTIWEDFSCSGPSIVNIVSPGIYNLADRGFNDKASSYRCV